MTTNIEKVRVRIYNDGSWQLVNGMMEYIPENKKATVMLPTTLNFLGLINYLTWKLNLPDLQDRFRLTYKSLSSGSIVEILNTEDVRSFLAIGVEISPEAIRLYICDRGDGSNQPNPEHMLPNMPYDPNPFQVCATPSNPYQSYQAQGSYQDCATPSNPYQSYQAQGSYQAQYQSWVGNQGSYQAEYQSWFRNQGSYQVQYQSYQVQYQSYEEMNVPSDHGIRISEVPAEEFDADGDNNEDAPQVYKVDIDPYYGAVCGDGLYHPSTDQYLGIESDGSDGGLEEDKSESDDEGHEVGADNDDRRRPTGSNLFWGMPPPLRTPVPVSKPKQPAVNYERSERVKDGQIFKSKDDLKLALGLKSLEELYQMKVTRSTTQRFEARCVCNSCEWRIRATVIADTKMFQVRVFKDIHTCSRTQVYPNHRNANKKVLGHILKDAMNDSSRLYKSHDIITDMKNNYKISVSYMQAWRAKCHALLLLRGDPEESFSVLPVYFHNLEKANPGTVTKIETDEMTRFERCFVAIGCAVRSFMNHLRPLIVIDGAHLKGPYLGTMFLAVGMDGNNQILPIAYGVGKTESGETWIWFLSKLKECIGEPENLCIISDRAPSINMAISVVFPTAKHGLCCRHIEMNLKFKGKQKLFLGKIFWQTCKAYTVEEFDQHLATLRQALSEPARNSLDSAPISKWSRAHFRGMRYNVMTSNSAESVNAMSRYARRLPIAMLMDFFRMSLQQWYYERREIGGIKNCKNFEVLKIINISNCCHFKYFVLRFAASLEQELTPWAEAKIRKRIEKSAPWTCHHVADNVFEVRDGYRNGVVDLRSRTCSCRKWQLSGIPCGHVIAVCRKTKITETNVWASKFYTTQVYKATYTEIVNPVNPPAAWEYPTEYMTVKPPLMEKPLRNRQRNVERIPSQGEVVTEKTCSRCQQKGHNRRDCANTIPIEVETLRENRRARAAGSRKQRRGQNG